MEHATHTSVTENRYDSRMLHFESRGQGHVGK